MLLTISTTKTPATDLGYLLHKHPTAVQSFNLAFGKVHVFYTEATENRCTAALLLDIDPVGLVRKRRGPGGDGGLLDQYVNDRPYVASSFLSVAIAQVFGTALSGRSKDRPELVDMRLPLTARLEVLPCRGGEVFLRKLFEPLGYEVMAQRHVLDANFPDWGESRYFSVELRNVCRLHELLSHLYVLTPVLDDEKHYWVGDDEVEKLLRHGEGWLAEHPLHAEIARRYLKHRQDLVQSALAQLREDQADDPDETAEERSAQEEKLEVTLSLHEQRLQAVLTELKRCGASRVLDLGCGEGKLLKILCEDPQFSEIGGIDVSIRALEVANRRLRLDRLPEARRQRIKLWHGSLMYRDRRMLGFDAAAVVEVIEHLDPPRLAAFERVLFEAAHPKTVVLTTPNVEYNVRFPGLPAGQFRHRDHRFEWSRTEFRTWAERVAQQHGYSVQFRSVGPEDPEVGAPTQMGVFTS
jgi:3' terminal RNA ribose 2'-O-methyltransferase Hen1